MASSEQFRPASSSPPPSSAIQRAGQLSPQAIPPLTLTSAYLPPRGKEHSNVLMWIITAAAVALITIYGVLYGLHQYRMACLNEMNAAAQEILKINQGFQIAGIELPKLEDLDDAQIQLRLVGEWHREMEDVNGARLMVKVHLQADGTAAFTLRPANDPEPVRKAAGVWRVQDRRLILSPAPSKEGLNLRSISESLVSADFESIRTKRADGAEVLFTRDRGDLALDAILAP